MKYESYLALLDAAARRPEIAADMRAFAEELRPLLEPVDPDGYDELLSMAGEPELAQVVRPAQGRLLSKAQRARNMQIAQQMLARLREDDAPAYGSLWAVNCWMNALAWPFCLIDGEYLREVDALEVQERELRAQEDDGYAAASLARLAEQAGDVQGAARWQAAAIDCCDVVSMRRMEHAARESGLTAQEMLALTRRHAALGDAQGLAEYALCLLETDGDEARALTMAMHSAAEDCPAGHYALYRCLHKRLSDGSVSYDLEDAAQEEMRCQLELAVRGGDPRAVQEAAQILNEEAEAEEEPQAFAYAPQADFAEATEVGEEPDCALPLLWRCISGVLAQVDQEMIDATGEPAPDEEMLDVLMACLSGAMRLYGSEARAKAAHDALIAQFDVLMPDFAGMDKAELNLAFNIIERMMDECRSRSAQAFGRGGDDFVSDWERICQTECEAIGMIVSEEIAQDDDEAQKRLLQAVRSMVYELREGLAAEA